MDTVHTLIKASKGRASVAVLVPFAFPLVVIWALGWSGHSLSDYPHLIATGELSWSRQAMMWMAMTAFVMVYVPPAINALATPVYLATSEQSIIVPSGQKISLADIESISIRKTFWHKIILVRTAGRVETVVVTFARSSTNDIRKKLSADPRLSTLIVE